MSAPKHVLAGSQPDFYLPFALSASARRSVLLATGTEPEYKQLFYVPHLTQLEPEQRSRLLDLLDKLDIKVDHSNYDTYEGPPEYVPDPKVQTTGYTWIHKSHDGSWVRYLPDGEGDNLDLNEVFFPGDKRTINALDKLRAGLDQAGRDRFSAMLDGAPLVEELDEQHELTIELVMLAYDKALELADRLIELADSGQNARHGWSLEPFEITDEAVILHARRGSEQPVYDVAVLKATDADAYERAKEIMATVKDVEYRLVQEAIDVTCQRWRESPYIDHSEAYKVENVLKNYMSNAVDEHEAAQRQAQANARYDECRGKWIAKHGSQRLKRAAARGYRHDGIYRDERLKLELPGFVGTLGKRAKTRELMNPSEEALEMEAEALARAEALGIDDTKVRLVYAVPDEQNPAALGAGEFVQVEEYLSRHTVFRSVSGRTRDDDIPF